MNVGKLLIPPCYLVEGASMLPTLTPGQHVFSRCVDHARPRIQRGDIVALEHPLGEDGVYIKRVVGLPDEFIHLKPDAVYVDELQLSEPYLDGPPCPESRYARQWLTESDEYFVLGDNRADSLDSRYFGPIHASRILGTIWYRCCPVRGRC